MLSLLACGQKMQFDSIARDAGGLVVDPGVENPTDPGVEDPTDPGEPDGPVVIDPPVVVDPPIIAPAVKKTEVFNQALAGKVDILFVVDNSPSMKKEQAKLGQRLSAFLAGLDNVDWQIAFTTTDVSNGKYGLKGSLQNLAGHGTDKILTSAYPDAEAVFLNTVQRSEVASSDEQPLKASILAMEKRNTDNKGFFREGANLAIIVLSDEDEMSKGTSKFATKPSEVVSAFRTMFGTTKKLSVYGIVIEPGDVACYNDQKGTGDFANAFYGSFVTELARITSGLTGSICDRDYAQNLINIGTDVRHLTEYFALSQTPVAGSVEVILSPAQNISWKVEGKTLTFATAPQEGSLIQVSYIPQ